MNDLSGIEYLAYVKGGIMLLVGFIGIGLGCLDFRRIRKGTAGTGRKRTGIEMLCVGAIALIYGIVISVQYIKLLSDPEIMSYEGVYVETHRNNRPAEPFTNYYVFDDESGEPKERFYLDFFSDDRILPSVFETGKRYIVYYEKKLR